MPSETVVLKIGGSTLGAGDTTFEDVAALHRRGTPVVVVHGGGPLISSWMERQGVQPSFVRGLRVTDQSSMEIVTAVLAGVVNKSLVSTLLGMGTPAVGVSGVDGGLLEAEIMDETLGLVGRVEQVAPSPLRDLLEKGYLPVVAPIARYCGRDSAYQGALLNVNGDTAAGQIAAAMRAARLVFLTDVEGVMDPSGRLLRRIDPDQVDELVSSGVARGGMVPKLEAARAAREGGVVTQVIDGRRPGSLLAALEEADVGTRVG